MLVERDEVGQKIDYPGLTYAPINEQGVVFLFAMMSDELGFSMESIRQAFPDAVAIDYRENRSREARKYIEFEFHSSHFSKQKGHDPEKCDIIVCWKHDWKNCPEKIEVIELRRIVQKEKGESGKSTASKRGTYQKSLAAERAPDIHDRLGCEVEMDRPSDTVLSGGSYQKIVY